MNTLQAQKIASFADVDSVLVMPLPEVVTELCNSLGSGYVAYVANVGHTKFVRAWRKGERPPRGIREQTLRTALQATRIILGTYSDNVVRAWFLGANRHLGVEAPATRLHEAIDAADLSKVVRAAWSFVTD